MVLVSATAVIALIASVVLRPSPTSPVKEVPEGGRATGGVAINRLQIGVTPRDVFSGLLASSLDLRDVPHAAKPESFRTSVEQWLGAYASDSTEMLRVMRESGITPPSAWSDPALAQDLFVRSTQALRQIRFDPDRSVVRRASSSEDAAHPFHGKPRRAGTRDQAREFLGTVATSSATRYEAIFFGTITGPNGEDSHVGLGLEFVLDAANSRWVLVRTVLYNIPNEVVGNAPVL